MIEATRLVGTGETQHVDNVDRTPPYDPRTGDHLWFVAVVYRVEPVDWTSGDPTVTPHLDGASVLNAVGPGCYYCEEAYTPRLRHRRCPGEPR